jgi:predicted hydrocarbon binding protein
MRVSSGIPILDQMLEGGFPPASVVCFIADPMSMAEVLLYQFSSVRKTYYFTTVRRPEYVQQNMESLNFPTDNINFVNIYSKFNLRENGEKYPTPRKNLYNIARHNASRSTRIFTRSANMPKDLFWKFNFWSKEKAIETLGEIVNKIFSEMMRVNEGSSLHFEDADPENARFVLRFSDCYECSGVDAKTPTCTYHAGMLAGIFSSLLGQEFDAYETECYATGGNDCRFVVGPKQDSDIQEVVTSNSKLTDVGVVDFMERFFKGMESDSNVVIDTFSFFLESKNTETIRRLLNVIYDTMNRINGVTLLYILKDAHPKEIERMIVNTCDIVLSLDVKERGEEIETSIAIPKIRGIVPLQRRVRVFIRERVEVDTSRLIA